MLWECTNITLPVPLKKSESIVFPSEAERVQKEERKKREERPWRSCTKENKQLQYVYSGVPEGRRGPDCSVPSIISEK